MFAFLRNQQRGASRTASPSRRSTPRIYINVPSYGGVFMTRAADAADTDQRTVDHAGRELSGEIEIDIPRGSGRRRCRAIRVTLRNVAKLYMGPDRGWEEDVLFERTLEVKGAIILEEGVSRFNFTIVVPFSLAPYDVHPTGRINTDIIAEVEGLATKGMKSPSPGSSITSSPAGTPRRGRSPVRQTSTISNYSLPEANGNRSGSGTPEESNAQDGLGQPDVDGIVTQMLVSWSDPVSSSAQDPKEGEAKWLHGNIKTQRTITLLYNPDPSNGVSVLDERRRGDVQGIGPFEVRYLSAVWTVCAPMNILLNFSDPSPKTAIYYARVSLIQRTVTTSPRDDPETAVPRITSTNFALWEKGTKPPPQRPTKDTPAFWRGAEADGKDSGGFSVTGCARLPTDETGRPSTLQGVVTPIHVTHSLVLEVFYSVYGEDVAGNALPTPGHGQLRQLKVDKPVIVPSCAFIPDVVELPSYESHKFCAEPCKVCGTPSGQQLCRTCLTSVPHVRHDHPPRIVGNEDGICPDCEKRFITDDFNHKWADCACGRSLEQLEERMGTLEDAGDDSAEAPAANGRKEEERGRSR